MYKRPLRKRVKPKPNPYFGSPSLCSSVSFSFLASLEVCPFVEGCGAKVGAYPRLALPF